MGVSTPFAPISSTVPLCKNLERKRLGHSRPNSSHRRSGARRIQVNSGTSISGHRKDGHWVPAVLSRHSACDDLQVERIEGGQRGGRRTTCRSGCRRRGPRRNRASRGSSGRGPRGAGALAAVTVDDLAHDAVTTAARHVGGSRGRPSGARWPRSSRVAFRVPADEGADPSVAAPSPLPLGRVGPEGHRDQGCRTGAHQLPTPSWTRPESPAARLVLPSSSPSPCASPWPNSGHPGPQLSHAHRAAQRFRPGRRTHGSTGTVTRRASRVIGPQ